MDYCDCGGDTSSKYCGICHKLMDEPWCIDCGRLVYVPDHEHFCECVNNRITKFRRSARIVAQLARDGITHRRWWFKACEDIDAARAEVARLRAECNDAQAVARAYILRAERAEAGVAAVWDALGNYETTGELALRNYIREQLERAALRQPAPAQE